MKRAARKVNRAFWLMLLLFGIISFLIPWLSIVKKSALTQTIVDFGIMATRNVTAVHRAIHRGMHTGTTLHTLTNPTQVVKASVTRDSEGYNLASHVRESCQTKTFKPAVLVSQKFTARPSLQFCPVWKVGTTTIKRLFLIKNVKKYDNYTNPYNISFLVPYKEKESVMSNSDNITRILFVRNPYDRVFSAYVDKVLAPNPVYWKILGLPVIRTTRINPSKQSSTCGHDATFPEFVRYVVESFDAVKRRNPKHVVESFDAVKRMNLKHWRSVLKPDGHFDTITKLCKPCDVKYDFVGKLETFSVDVKELLKYLDLPATDKLIQSDGAVLATVDAIRDTTYQPFDPVFQKGFSLCNITRKQILQRAWFKLKIRGLIGNQNFTISDATLKTFTYDQFLNMAMDAHGNSSKQERQAMKRQFYRSFYLSVDKHVRDSLKTIYADDFRIFHYNNTLDLT